MKSKTHIDNKNTHYARAHVCGVVFLFLCLVGSTGLMTSPALAKRNPPTIQEPVKLTAEQAFESQDPARRHVALDTVRRHKGRISGDKLRASKQIEKNPILRRQLNQAMAASQVSNVEMELISSLERDDSALVRVGAAQTLGNYVQTRGVIEALINALKVDQDMAVRVACARSLGLSDTPPSVLALEKASTDSNPRLRRAVAASLKRHTSKVAQQSLKKLRKDVDPSVRRTAGGSQ